MLKFEGVAKVGQFIKAMDFRPREGQDDMFVIGKVLRYEIGRCGFIVECKFDTEGHRVGEEVFVPFEMAGFSEFDNRVQYVSDASFRLITTGRR
jgi:hypothetical protein